MNEELEKELLKINDLEERAYALVSYLFLDVLDKGGKPYVGHLVRVRDKFQNSFYRTVALLHDVVEDTSVTLSDLYRLGFSSECVDTLELLTRNKEISYHEYVSRIINSKNKCALLIKLADMEDNMSLDRLDRLSVEIKNRLLNKYNPEMVRLKQAKGEMELC